MDEAYAVGVRLVLDDAVTPALAKLERQLGAFDAGMAARVAHVPQPKAADKPVAVAPASVPAPDAPLPPPRAVGEAPLPRAAAPLPREAKASETVRTIRETAPAPAPVTRLAFAPVSAAAQRKPVDYAHFAPTPAPQPAEPIQLPRAPGPMSLPGWADTPQTAPAEPSPPAAAPAPPAWPSFASAAPPAAPVAPIPTAPRAQPPERTLPTSASDQQTDAAPAPTPIGGDVILDGMRVGRWLARELGRQADMPQTSTTFFDPRAGATWPGTLQGEAAR
jgi:hypothetical protein